MLVAEFKKYILYTSFSWWVFLIKKLVLTSSTTPFVEYCFRTVYKAWCTTNINVEHVREGDILAMQGEAMTTQAAWKTAFQVLLVVNNGWNIEAETFSWMTERKSRWDGEGGKWSLGRFYGGIVGESVNYIRSISQFTSFEWISASSQVLNEYFSFKPKVDHRSIKWLS